MLERRRIVELYRTGRAQVLVTLIRTEGSSYRRPGAHLLLGSDGVYAGTISGGCLEAEVVRKAMWMVRKGPVVERYSTMFDDTAEIPYGLGCGGTVDLLLERTDTAEAGALLEAMEASLDGEERRVLTWLPEAGSSLRRAVLDGAGRTVFQSGSLKGEEFLRSVGTADVYLEELEAPQRLVVLGAGDDARPLTAMAALLGWRIVVADGRAQMARAERFPEAHEVTVLRDPGVCAQFLRIGPKDAVVLMTHSYEQDRGCLAAVLATASVRYIGVLGARHRTALLVAEAAALNGQTIAACCSRIHAPIGLDLGGDGPEAIALAIVAEIQAACQGKLPASRRLTAADVAEQIERGGASRYLQVQCAAAVGVEQLS
jgi:xanthine dehydrogenase accessory factor